MMVKWAALAAVIALSGCHKADWQTFAPEGGKFSVVMPGKPSDNSHTHKTPQGDVTSHLYLYSNKDSTYAISYRDLPPSKDAVTPDQFLDRMRAAEVASSGGTLLASASLKLANGAPGREIEVAVREGDGKHAMRDRIYLVNNRMYQVLVVLPTDQLDAPDTLKYLDSFKVQ